MNVGKSKDMECISVADKSIVQLFKVEGDRSGAGEWMLKSDSAPRIKAAAAAESVELDMGMGSRVEGFRICGHR